MLVKRLASLHCNNNSNLEHNNNLKSLHKQQTKEIKNCRRDRNSNRSSESEELNDNKRNKLVPTSEQFINDTISESSRTEQIMGSNVSSGKGLSGRRTQSQSKYMQSKYVLLVKIGKPLKGSYFNSLIESNRIECV